ncbi:MAG: hypothetical protein R3F59_37480 [Myxococcota bacterium]
MPGPIERALALEALTEGAVGVEAAVAEGAVAQGTVGDAVRAARRAGVVQAKLFAAWFLAVAMPALVLVMKLTAGSRLEPYLRRRWAGRDGAGA